MLAKFKIIVIALLFGGSALADDYSSHSTVSMYRSSYQTYTFFSQTIEAGFGQLDIDAGKQVSDWKSSHLRSEFGLETLKFFQLSAGFIKSDYGKKGEKTSVMDRQSLFGELKLILAAPMMNIEVGTGAVASTMQVVTQQGDGNYGGSGTYYTASVSRFLNSRLSIFARGSQNDLHFVKDSGNFEGESIDISDRTFGVGIKFYF